MYYKYIYIPVSSSVPIYLSPTKTALLVFLILIDCLMERNCTY